VLLGLTGAALVLIFVPPVSDEARRYEFVETIQFCLAAFAVPALLVHGRPLRLVRVGTRARIERRLGRLAEGRRRHPFLVRALLFAVAFVGVAIAWRTPPLMDDLARHGWLVVVELLSLVAVGVPLWGELVSVPPLAPRLAAPWRAVVAALSMWGVWVMAYLVGFSRVSWYVAFHHASGGLTATSDQELSTALMWFGAAVSFVPVVFFDLLTWLHNGEDPDAELRALMRQERRWGPRD
jgi:cytochrome c oxidase assembly factor CtaG